MKLTKDDAIEYLDEIRDNTHIKLTDVIVKNNEIFIGNDLMMKFKRFQNLREPGFLKYVVHAGSFEFFGNALNDEAFKWMKPLKYAYTVGFEHEIIIDSCVLSFKGMNSSWYDNVNVPFRAAMWFDNCNGRSEWEILKFAEHDLSFNECQHIDLRNVNEDVYHIQISNVKNEFTFNKLPTELKILEFNNVRKCPKDILKAFTIENLDLQLAKNRNETITVVWRCIKNKLSIYDCVSELIEKNLEEYTSL